MSTAEREAAVPESKGRYHETCTRCGKLLSWVKSLAEPGYWSFAHGQEYVGKAKHPDDPTLIGWNLFIDGKPRPSSVPGLPLRKLSLRAVARFFRDNVAHG